MEIREGIPIEKLESLSEMLSLERIPEDKRPTQEDWREVQGGKPEIVFKSDKLCYVIHRYENKRDPSGTGAVIPTSINEVRGWGGKKTLTMDIKGRQVEFPIAMLWKFHGKPCENNSKSRYDRVKI